jgi:hypothetical protein
MCNFHKLYEYLLRNITISQPDNNMWLLAVSARLINRQINIGEQEVTNMEHYIGRSTSSNPELCVNEATAHFRNPKLIVFFSQVDSFDKHTELIYAKFPNSVCIGSTTIAAFSKDGADKTGLKAVAFEDGISCEADVLEEVDKYPIRYVERVRRCADRIRSTQNTICLEFTTALLCAEESVLSTLNSVLLEKKIPIFGGTAGDPGTATGTKVSLNGRVYEKSTVFALIHNEGGAVRIYRENIYEPLTGNVMTATKVNTETRTVYEFNHQPATSVFANELGVQEHQITKYFDTSPLGRIVGDDMFVTANCALADRHGITYHARLYENAKVMVLKPSNYRDIVAKTMNKIHREIPNPSFSIMCHCLARTLLFDGEGYLQEYARTMSNVLGNYIGFSGYGEQAGEHHFNQTMIVAVFE